MKDAARRVSVPTPSWAFAGKAEDAEKIAKRLKFPMLVKPAHGYASVGIRRNSRVSTLDELREQVKLSVAEFGRALVEEFIEGREFTCLVAENPSNPNKPYTYTPVEFIFPGRRILQTLRHEMGGLRKDVRCGGHRSAHRKDPA